MKDHPPISTKIPWDDLMEDDEPAEKDNPFDDIFGEPVGEMLGGLVMELGVGIWGFLLTPIGFVIGVFAWFQWRSPFLLVCSVAGMGTYVFASLMTGIAVVGMLVFQRGKGGSSGWPHSFLIASLWALAVSWAAGISVLFYCGIRISG